MDSMVGSEPPDGQSLSACECASTSTELVQELSSVEYALAWCIFCIKGDKQLLRTDNDAVLMTNL